MNKDTQNINHTIGSILFAKKRPIEEPVISKVADHTYLVAVDNNNLEHKWKALGGDTGGETLDGTMTNKKDSIDITSVDYMMTKAPCIWPMEYYAVVGVCWNACNRGLYFTGKTVHNIKFYALVEHWFGTYGLDDDSTCWRKKSKEGRKLYSWSKALKAIKENAPWMASHKPDAIMATSENARVRLYHEFYGETAQTFNVSLSDGNKWFAYLQRLVSLGLQEALGEISSDKEKKMLEAHRMIVIEPLKMKTFLTEREDISEEEFVEQQLGDLLELYKEILSDTEYQALFLASKSDIFFLPSN